MCRLFERVTDPHERSDMMEWFVTGKLPHYDIPPNLSNEAIEFRFRCRSHFIKEGSAGLTMSATSLQPISSTYTYEAKESVQFQEILYISIIIPCKDCPTGRYPTITLYLFIIRGNIENIFEIDNLQIMCSCLNFVKGHFSYLELQEWYSSILSSILIEID